MLKFLGCLFILFFGAIFLLVGLTRHFMQALFGRTQTKSGPQQGRSGGAYGPRPNRQTGASRREAQAGNAHHEGTHNANSRQRRSGKIFEKNEGQYVDFEEI